MELFFKLNPIALTLLIPGLICAALTLYTFNIRGVAGSRVFAFVMLAVSVWSLAYGAELASLNLESMLLATKVEYFGIVTVPVLWMVLTLLYTGRRKWVRPRNIIYLFIVPLITLVLVCTTQFHEFYYGSINLDSSGPFLQLSLTGGPWFWVNSVYSYLAVLLSSGLLIERLRDQHPAYHRQIIAMLIGVSVPWIVNILYLCFHLALFGHVDLTPFAFAVSGIVIAWAIFRYRLFNVIPLAREYVIESMREGVIVVDSENKLGDLNAASRQIFGLDDSDIGKPITDILKEWPEIIRQNQSNESSRQEIIHGKDDNKHAFEVTISTLYERRGRPMGRLTIIRDITEWVTLTQKLERIATHDPLTGLPDRLLLIDRVDMAIARANRNNSKLAVMMLDLDRFKTINDTLGHGVGDDLLKAVSKRLEDQMRKNDTLARFGGDEFVILLPEIVATEEAKGAACRFLETFQNPISVDGHSLQVSFSLGIAIFPEDGQNFDELIKQADIAMYEAKNHGKNRYEFFKPSEKTNLLPWVSGSKN